MNEDIPKKKRRLNAQIENSKKSVHKQNKTENQIGIQSNERNTEVVESKAKTIIAKQNEYIRMTRSQNKATLNGSMNIQIENPKKSIHKTNRSENQIGLQSNQRNTLRSLSKVAEPKANRIIAEKNVDIRVTRSQNKENYNSSK